MLFTIQSNGNLNQVDPNYIPHSHEFRIWRARLSDPDYQAIVEEINRRADGKPILTAGWEATVDPSGKKMDGIFPPVFEPIYYAVNQDFDQAALFYGNLFWTVMARHPDSWSFGRYELNGLPIRSMTYFRIQV